MSALIYVIIILLYAINSIGDVFLIKIIKSIAMNRSILERVFRDYRFVIIKVSLTY